MMNLNSRLSGLFWPFQRSVGRNCFNFVWKIPSCFDFFFLVKIKFYPFLFPFIEFVLSNSRRVSRIFKKSSSYLVSCGCSGNFWRRNLLWKTRIWRGRKLAESNLWADRPCKILNDVMNHHLEPLSP